MIELFRKDIEGDDVKILIAPRETDSSYVYCGIYYKRPRKWYQREGKYVSTHVSSVWLSNIVDWGCDELTEWAEKTLEEHNRLVLKQREKEKVLRIIEKGCK